MAAIDLGVPASVRGSIDAGAVRRHQLFYGRTGSGNDAGMKQGPWCQEYTRIKGIILKDNYLNHQKLYKQKEGKSMNKKWVNLAAAAEQQVGAVKKLRQHAGRKRKMRRIAIEKQW